MNNNNNKERKRKNNRMKWKNSNDNEKTKREIEMINDNDEMKIWTANYIGEPGARMISESLKTNTTLTELNLSSGDEKWSKMKWIIIKIIKKTKEWMNEMKNSNDNEKTKREIEMINDNDEMKKYEQGTLLENQEQEW